MIFLCYIEWTKVYSIPSWSIWICYGDQILILFSHQPSGSQSWTSDWTSCSLPCASSSLEVQSRRWPRMTLSHMDCKAPHVSHLLEPENDVSVNITFESSLFIYYWRFCCEEVQNFLPICAIECWKHFFYPLRTEQSAVHFNIQQTNNTTLHQTTLHNSI